MPSNKSSPGKVRTALQPQRSHGKSRVAALLEAGAAVIAEKGFQSATMAEIAARAGAPIGSLYRFFPNKELLADALLQRFGDLISTEFGKIESRITSMSTGALAEALLNLMVDLHGERLAVRALLEAHADWSAKRVEFRSAMRRRIARALILRCPKLEPRTARNIAVILLQNIKTVGILSAELHGDALTGAVAELHRMTRLYLEATLDN